MAPKGWYHASDFSLKNKRPPGNIIFIDTLRAARVFIAFTFPKPYEKEVYDKIGAGKEKSPSKLSQRVRFEKWRTNGAMNFEKEDADRSLWKRVIHQRVLVRVLVQKKNAEVAVEITGHKHLSPTE